jgi:hypothetical protein
VGPAVVGKTARTPKVGVSVLGLTQGVPVVKVGPSVVGASARTPMVRVPVLGLTLGDPGIKVGLSVVGATVMGALVRGETVAGAEEGLPGVTVPLCLQGHKMVPVQVLGLTLEVPGVKVCGQQWWDQLSWEHVQKKGRPGVTVCLSLQGHQWWEFQYWG